jgi:hypothetical protein
MAASEREARVIALLEDCVRTELEVTNAGRGLGLSPEAIEDLMVGVTSGVLYGFAVDWDPDWVRTGDVHAWQESDRWIARCGVCLADSPASASREVGAQWALDHEGSHAR